MTARTLARGALILLATLAWPRPDGTRVSHASPNSSLLVAQGRQREFEGDELTALKRYSDAVVFDRTSEEAYLALGGLRARRGEWVEAEVVFGQGVLSIPQSIDLLVARARARRTLRRHDEAAQDLRRAMATEGGATTPHSVGLLRELIALERVLAQPAAELAAWRRLLAVARVLGDAALTHEAVVQVRALGLYMGDLDPVLHGRSESDSVRRSMAAIGRRGG